MTEERSSYEYTQNRRKGSINAKDFLIGSLVGGVIGSLTALLLAPKSGKEFRCDINQQAHLLKEKSGELRDTVVVKGSEIASTVKDKTASISKTVSQQSTGLVNIVKGLKENVIDKQENDEEKPVDEEKTIDEVSESNIESEIVQKLEETKKAFVETESKVTQE